MSLQEVESKLDETESRLTKYRTRHAVGRMTDDEFRQEHGIAWNQYLFLLAEHARITGQY